MIIQSCVGSTLVVVMKLVSLAFDTDTQVTTSSKGPPRSPLPVPHIIPYLSYCFFPASTLFGPYMTFEEHSKYTRGTPLVGRSIRHDLHVHTHVCMLFLLSSDTVYQVYSETPLLRTLLGPFFLS